MSSPDLPDPTAPILDQSRLQEEFGADPEVLTELRDLFLEHAPPLLEQMRTAWRQGDSEALARAAHSLKGAASTYGAVRMSEVCRALELAAREGRLEGLQESLERLEHELGLVGASFGELSGSRS